MSIITNQTVWTCDLYACRQWESVPRYEPVIALPPPGWLLLEEAAKEAADNRAPLSFCSRGHLFEWATTVMVR